MSPHQLLTILEEKTWGQISREKRWLENRWKTKKWDKEEGGVEWRKKEEEAWAREEKKVKKKKEERRKWNVGGRRKAEWGSESGHCVHNDHYCVHSNLRKIGQRKCERLERSVLHSTTVGKKICERLESGCALYKLVQAVTISTPNCHSHFSFVNLYFPNSSLTNLFFPNLSSVNFFPKWIQINLIGKVI